MDVVRETQVLSVRVLSVQYLVIVGLVVQAMEGDAAVPELIQYNPSYTITAVAHVLLRTFISEFC